MADFKFSHSTPWKYSWQHMFSETTLALNSFKSLHMGRKRTGAILTLFMTSFGNSLGVGIHSFCSVVPPLSHMAPMFRLSISNSNKSISGFQCHYAKAGRKALRQPRLQKTKKASPPSFSFAGDPAPPFPGQSLSFWQDRTDSNSFFTFIAFFCVIKQLPLNFSWAGSCKEKTWDRGNNGNWDLAAVSEGVWMPISKLFHSPQFVNSLSSQIILHSPPPCIIHSCYSFCWQMYDNWKLLSYGGIILHQSTTRWIWKLLKKIFI